MFISEIYEINNRDMAKAELDIEFGGIVVDKKMFSFKRIKRFKLKPIIRQGELKKIKIYGPYGFIVKLFKMFNYKPMISEEYDFNNWFGAHSCHIYKEEWYNPCYDDNSQDEDYRKNIDSDELPF